MEAKVLEDFLHYIYDFHTDEYGQLMVCKDGDELDPTIERVVEQYLERCEKN